MGLEERRKRERENRKNAILKAARKLFFEKGYRPVTVESIARKAELSKGSIYLYYSSKEEIYSQILLSDIEKFHDRVIDILPGSSGASGALVRLAEIYVDFFLNDRELFRILMNFMIHNNGLNLPDDLNIHIIKTTNRAVDVFEKILKAGMEKGEFPPDIDLRLNRNAIWGLLNGIIALHLFVGKEARRAEAIRSTIKAGLEIYIKGLRSSACR